MTTSIPVEDPPSRHDQWKRYLIKPPNGGQPTGYSRVTTIAKVLDGGGGLAPWKATMTVCGMMARKGLRARWEALLAETNGDPWYASEEHKKACKGLVEDCCDVGGANDRAEMGTALHAITALVDRGRTPKNLSEQTEADVNAYVSGLIAAGVTVLPDYIEQTIVIDSVQIAGTFDRLANVPGFELPLIADLKTGADLSYGWQAMAVQLAAYSRAEAIYKYGAASDGSEDIRSPMPAVDQNYGLILWLNAGTAKLELFLVDLTAGWEAFERSLWVRQWRNTDTAQPLGNLQQFASSDDDALLRQLEASILAVEAGKPEPVIDDYHQQLRDWYQDRINVIGKHSPEARADLGRSWPLGVPTLKDSRDHTFEQFAAIETVLIGVEGRHSVPFGPSRPIDPDTVGTVVRLFPGSVVISNNNNSKDNSA